METGSRTQKPACVSWVALVNSIQWISPQSDSTPSPHGKGGKRLQSTARTWDRILTGVTLHPGPALTCNDWPGWARCARSRPPCHRVQDSVTVAVAYSYKTALLHDVTNSSSSTPGRIKENPKDRFVRFVVRFSISNSFNNYLSWEYLSLLHPGFSQAKLHFYSSDCGSKFLWSFFR